MGGAIPLLYKKGGRLKVENIDVGKCEGSEDVMVVRVECRNECGRTEEVVYMTVMGEVLIERRGGTTAYFRKGDSTV